MKKILLPNGLNVSEVSLGAMNFGTSTSKEESFRTLDTYMDIGGNFIDTSNNYAHWQGTGDESETLLGEWFRERGSRDKVVLATRAIPSLDESAGMSVILHGTGSAKLEEAIIWEMNSITPQIYQEKGTK